jgi:hypothetical protein
VRAGEFIQPHTGAEPETDVVAVEVVGRGDQGNRIERKRRVNGFSSRSYRGGRS